MFKCTNKRKNCVFTDCLKFTYDIMLLPEEFGECHNLSDHMTPSNTDQWDIFKVTHKVGLAKKILLHTL